MIWLLGTSFLFLGLSGNFLLSFAGLVLVILSMRLGFPILKQVHNEESKLFYILRHQPRRIVWIYGIVTEHFPFGLSIIQSAVLYIKLIDGDELTVSVSPRKMKMVLKTLGRLLPHATQGYTKDLEQRYEKQPGQLLKNFKPNR